jgi:hypothetical protein
MGFLTRKSGGTSGGSLPRNIVTMMDRFGRFEFDPAGSVEDGGTI